MTTLHAGGKFDGEPTRCPAVCTASARRWSTPCPPARGRDPPRRPRVDADVHALGAGPARGRRRQRRRTARTVTLPSDPEIFAETTTYSRETLHRRLQEMAFLNKGLSITLRDERLELTGGEVVAETMHYPGGLEDYVRHLNTTRSPVHPTVIGVRRRDHDRHAHVGRGGDAVERLLLRVGATPSPTPSTRRRAAPTRRGSARP